MNKNRALNFFGTLCAFILLCFLFAEGAQAAVVINEVMPNPVGSDTENEWIEIFNTNNTSIDLNGYKLNDLGGATLVIDTEHVDGATTINGNSFLVVRRNEHTTFSLNNDGDTITLYLPDGNSAENVFSYNGSNEGKSWGRIPDGGDIHSEPLNPTPGTGNDSSTPSPTFTTTPSPTQSQATVNISKAVDGQGLPLSSVKIYIDGNYTGNHTEETYNFCDGCTCGTNKVTCGYGNHTFRFERSGYTTYEKSENVQSGNTYQINPVLNKEGSPATTLGTSTSAPSPTAKSGFSVSLPLSTKPTPSDNPDIERKDSVLGIQGQTEEEEEEAEEETTKPLPKLAYFLVFAGVLLLGYPVYVLLKARKKKNVPKESATKTS